jgi:SAM-dependent methyltransferase
MSDNLEAAASNKRAVKQITLLMPVWGYQFIGRFLEFCLPTLLAPNNIPAIARELPCRFVLLSSEVDESIIRSHPAWQKLERHCACEIQPIDDLITQGNHTATITLAFERALRQSGEAMRDTCFIFLMSDYLVADGSLETVLRTIETGANAVLAGNFQIIAEDAAPLLRQHADLESHEIVLPPRYLVRWSLAHLHPATVANTVNFGLIHNAHINRLFWRVDEDCLIGRFYLMHPIAIHPETSDFVVGSSWDYSFVPELCPSGNIAALTDSDDYLVVELQPRNYEWENLRPGPIIAAELAQSLAEWTTVHHRRNVAQTVVFHAADRPAELAQFVVQSAAFVESVRQSLVAPPLDHRLHPYWIGSIAVNRRRSHRPLGKADWSFLLRERADRSRSSFPRLQAKLFGSPPEVTRLHPLWPDYRLPLNALNDILSSNGRVLVVAHDAEPFAQWLVGAPGGVVTMNSDHLLQLTHVQYSTLAGTFDACVLFSGDAMLNQSDVLIEHIAPLLKSKGRLVFMVTNSLSALDVDEFGRNFASQAGRLLNRSVWIEDIQYVELSPRRSAIRHAMTGLAVQSGRMQFLAAAAAVPVALANYLANVAARSSSTPPLGAWSSVCLTLRASEQPAPYPARFAREAALARAGLAAVQRIPVPSEDLQMPVDLLTRSPQASRLWQDDEPRLASHLAHYRFIAAMMGVRNDVAEYGCTSPTGTRLVLQQSRKMTLYDPRPLVVGDLQWRFQDDWRFEARLHDITSKPLPRQIDSAYCVDFLQYISRDEEDNFVRNLRDSLSRDSDFLLIGSPSYGAGDPPGRQHAPCADTPQAFAAQSSRENLPCQSRSARGEAVIYRRTGAELKALMERFFQNVFVFSMVDDVAQPGIQPNAQHVFTLSCGKKD